MLPRQAYAALAQRQQALMTQMNRAGGGRLRLEWDWLLVVARKPGPVAS